MSKTNTSMERNIRTYPVFAALHGTYFWMPVFFLYFSSKLDIAGVLQLEAVYYFSVVVLEVPSGIFSDRMGRKPTLLISTLAAVIASAVFLIADTFMYFAIAQVLLAVSIAFQSGTDTSFHHDSLAQAGREHEYATREARVAKYVFLASALGAIGGGLAGSIDLRGAYVLAFIASLLAFGSVVRFTEPSSCDAPQKTESLPKQLANCAAYLKRPPIRWVFAFAIVTIIINHIPYEFYQPYLQATFDNTSIEQLQTNDAATPLTSGLHLALAMLAASFVASRSMVVNDRFGTKQTLLLCVGFQTLLIGMMAAVISPIVAALMILRSTPGALARAPMNSALVPRLQKHHRATFLSLQSLAGRLGFASVLLGLSAIAAQTTSGSALSTMLSGATGLAVLGFVVLLVLPARFDCE